jgi:hypothetical protein
LRSQGRTAFDMIETQAVGVGIQSKQIADKLACHGVNSPAP